VFNGLRSRLKERRTRRLLRNLHGAPSELEYTAAVYAWRRSGLRDPRAVEPFIQALRRHSNSYLREWAAEVLGELGDARAIDPLVEALVDPGDSDRADPMAVRRAAATALAKLGEVDFRALGGIDDPTHGLRRLAESGDPRLLRPLLWRLRDARDSGVRVDAAAALGRLDDPRAVRPLIAATRDGDREVRSQAYEALGELNEGLKFLVTEVKRGSDSAVMGLMEFAGVRGVDAVIELMDQCQGWQDEDGYRLFRALGQIGGARAFQRLRQEVEGGETEAIWPLARTGDPRAVDVLIQLLSDHDAPAIRDPDAVAVEHAAGALAKLGDVRAVEPLIHVLENNRNPPLTAEDFYHADGNRKKVVTRVIKALGDLGDPRAIAEVRKLTKHQPDEIQAEAFWALRKLNFEETVADRD
jgi:HEAT repeat protein